MAQEIFIATTNNIKDDEMFYFKYKGRPAFLIRYNDAYKAYLDICTHEAAKLKWSGGDEIGCCKHSAVFDTETGKAKTLPAPINSHLMEIKIAIKDNKIYHFNTIVFKSKH